MSLRLAVSEKSHRWTRHCGSLPFRIDDQSNQSQYHTNECIGMPPFGSSKPIGSPCAYRMEHDMQAYVGVVESATL